MVNTRAAVFLHCPDIYIFILRALGSHLRVLSRGVNPYLIYISKKMTLVECRGERQERKPKEKAEGPGQWGPEPALGCGQQRRVFYVLEIASAGLSAEWV